MKQKRVIIEFGTDATDQQVSDRFHWLVNDYVLTDCRGEEYNDLKVDQVKLSIADQGDGDRLARAVLGQEELAVVILALGEYRNSTRSEDDGFTYEQIAKLGQRLKVLSNELFEPPWALMNCDRCGNLLSEEDIEVDGDEVVCTKCKKGGGE